MSLVFHYGAMNAGKSVRILQMAYQYHGKISYGIYTCELDTDKIESRIGIERKCDHVSELFKSRINRYRAAILIDEAQWLSVKQVTSLRKWVDEVGVEVHCFGLRTDTDGSFFEGAEALFKLADKCTHMTSFCAKCSKQAILHNKVSGMGKESFEAVCFEHFNKESK